MKRKTKSKTWKGQLRDPRMTPLPDARPGEQLIYEYEQRKLEAALWQAMEAYVKFHTRKSVSRAWRDSKRLDMLRHDYGS